jgi:uncharacterized YigZ family protein
LQEKNYNYKEVANEGFGDYREKGSKFFAYAFPCTSVEELKARVKLLKKEYYQARHFCYAYIFDFPNSQEKAGDDGEPAGSAGLPILNQIKSAELTNTAIVVVRYFGGTKLGVPGLISAYGESAILAINNCKIDDRQLGNEYELVCSYENVGALQKVFKKYSISVDNQSFQQEVTFIIKVQILLTPQFKNEISELHAVRMKVLKEYS